jgi:dTDP-glucose 4,6-dehydratase
MKNILITGVAGFIASNLACYLVKKYPNYFFLGIDKISYCSSIKNFEEIVKSDNFEFVKADFTNLEFMDFLFGKYQIDTVLHLGAYTHVDMSFGDSIIYTQNNVVGTHVLMEVSKKNNIHKFIHVSTDEVYGSVDGESHEGSLLSPTNPYSASKAAAEQIVRSYYHSFKLPIIITRGNNVYGPKQYPEKLIPKFCLKLLNGEKLTIQGSGQQKRSFLYVDDVCRAFDIILHNGKIGETYNIGCKHEYSVLETSQKLLEYFGYDLEKDGNMISYIEDRPFNDHRYFISTAKLEELGWKQEILFDEGLIKTIKWYAENKDYFI